MNQPIIEVKNISKKYQISHMKGGYVTLRDVISNIIKSPLSSLKSKLKQVIGLEKKEQFWALSDVSFNVNRGEIVGIIGSNGAGKSTLLKILSQITPPTEGEIILHGKVGSLLEVGTGFHPELTGRENIFLNGAILGMKKSEIIKKFDEIVAFAEVEKFLDTPVKHYSSGMYVRLAFSVAAHMEPDILLVDEVLAVGDAEFQKKCLGKMDEITKKDGRTIIFVSHNLSAIRSLCTTSVLLEKGQVKMIGPTEDVIDFYQKQGTKTLATELRTETNRRGDGRVKLVGFHIEDEHGNMTNIVESGKDMIVALSYECKHPDQAGSVDVGFTLVKSENLVSILYSSYSKKLFNKISRDGVFRFRIKNNPLASGVYGVGARIVMDGVESDWPKNVIGTFEIINPKEFEKSGRKTHPSSTIILEGEWS